MRPFAEEQPHASAQWDLHKAGEAVWQHLLPHLCFSNLLALSRTSSHWHQLILATPVHQLRADAVRVLLPSGMTSCQSLGGTLQERANLMARLRGKLQPSGDAANAPNNTVAFIQHQAFQGQAVGNILWCPQTDISTPSQHIGITNIERISAPHDVPEDDKYRLVVTLLDLSRGQPVNLQATGCYRVATESQMSTQAALTGPSWQALAGTVQPGPVQCKSLEDTAASWIADGQHLVVTLLDVSPLASPDATSARAASEADLGTDPTSHLDWSEDPMILVNIPAGSKAMVCNQHARRYISPGPISPSNDMMIWVQQSPNRMPNSSASEDCLAVYQLPSLEMHPMVEPPAFPNHRPDQPRRMRSIVWAPDGSKFAIQWTQVMAMVPVLDQMGYSVA